MNNPIMKINKISIRHILGIVLLCGGIISATAQSSATRSLHETIHREQLANAKSRLDKSVIKDFIKHDIERREEAESGIKPMTSATSAMLTDLLSEAKSHLGKRYRSGAKGPAAFDCSGFSSYVFRQFGYSLGASSRDQYKQGEKIDVKDLRIGDLVFFTGRNRKGGVGHVGIVVSADNEKGTFKFIHASTSQGIKIDSNTGYYDGRYLGARRVIDNVE